jgi:hypothetical protein
MVGDLSSKRTSPQAEFALNVSDLHPTKDIFHNLTFLLTWTKIRI